MSAPEEHQAVSLPTDPWEANRDRQLEFWAAQPVSRRIAWLEEAVGAALRSGALPKADTTSTEDSLLPPLAGSPESVERGLEARSAALRRLSDYFRGPCPPEFQPMEFAEFGVLVRFALWRLTDAATWNAHRDAGLEDLFALAERGAGPSASAIALFGSKYDPGSSRRTPARV